MATKALPPMKPPAEKKPPMTPEAVEALARLSDENYGKPKPPGEGEPPVTPPAAPETPPEAPQAPQPVETAQPPAAEPETPPAPVVAKKPWEENTSNSTKILFHPEASLHAKMDWICNNVPKMSRLRLTREGTEMLCDMLIAKHFKEEA